MPFYVGKGYKRRAWHTASRNRFWKRIAKKHKYRVEIVKYFETPEEAYALEACLISLYKTFQLCEANITDGGSGGQLGVRFSKETRLKLSAKAKERLSTPENNPCYGRTGKQHPVYGRKFPRQSEKLKGKRGTQAIGFTGYWHCGEYGIFESSNLAAEALEIHPSTVKQRVRNKWPGWRFEKIK